MQPAISWGVEADDVDDTISMDATLSVPIDHFGPAVHEPRVAPAQALYPETGGVAPILTRPVMLLIVRKHRRGLANNDDVRMDPPVDLPVR